MTLERRPQLAQRRRRVLYTHRTVGEQTAADGRRAAALREARRPATPYGSRVYRRLRARWFGVVPVRWRTMAAVTTGLLTAVLLLTIAHAAALSWAPLAYRPEVARPWRLDRPDSFGNWLGSLLFASAAFLALMIYQLRRHRSDDYQGHYRLWRPAIILLALGSLDTSMLLTDWLGQLVDTALGQRRALAGGDWVRLLLVVGGATFGLRMLAEVRRSKAALGYLLAAGGFLVFPTLVRWNIVAVDSLTTATLLASARLLGTAALWLALLSYLRMLYREVRNLNHGPGLRQQARHWQQRLLETARLPRRQPAADTDSPPPREAKRQPAADERSDKPASARPRPRLFGWRRRRQAETATDGEAPDPHPQAETPEATATAEAADAPAKPRRRWLPAYFSKRAADTAAGPDENAAATETPAEETQPSPPQPTATAPPSPAAPSPAATSPAATSGGDDGEEDEWIDPESIDWQNLSKSQRRRLKRQLKRQDRAA